MIDRMRISEDVAHALAGRHPVLALETTLVTHGLPAPDGVNVALELETAVREAGAVPATIVMLAGRVHVGIGEEELRTLAATPHVEKLNLGNFAAQLASGGSGSTTVAATMMIAARIGITTFATGGIGGVHRGVAESFDVSAGLAALSRWRVAVVCAGAKAILDLPKTLEALETLGVPVLGNGTGEFPAFYRRSSGLPLDRRFDDPATLAAAIRAHFELGAGGVLVANPIPEADELPQRTYETALASALAELAASGVRGRAVTPFLLDRLRALTGGASVTANRALLLHNARVAGALAEELARHEAQAGRC